jgi:hypothetical protein
MNGAQANEAQKPPLVSTGSSNSANGSNLSAKKRKKDALKPIITTEGTAVPQQGDEDGQTAQDTAGYVPSFLFFGDALSFCPSRWEVLSRSPFSFIVYFVSFTSTCILACYSSVAVAVDMQLNVPVAHHQATMPTQSSLALAPPPTLAGSLTP